MRKVASPPSSTLAPALAGMGLSLLVSLVLAEVGVYAWSSSGHVYDIEVWRYSLEVKEKDPDPRRSFRHRPDVDTTLYGADVHTNHQGFRMPRDIKPEKPEGTRRLVLLGDSITFGWGVQVGDTFASRLPTELGDPHLEVINTGVGNYGTVQEVATFENVALAYQPDAVVLCYFINDAEPVPVYVPHPWWSRWRLGLLLWSRLDRLKRVAGDHQDWKGYYRALYQAEQPGWKAAQSAITHLGELAHQAHIPAWLVIFPDLHVLDAATYPFYEEQARVAAVGESAGLTVVDLTPSFLGLEARPLWVSDEDTHPNKEGHHILAKGIADTLKVSPW